MAQQQANPTTNQEHTWVSDDSAGQDVFGGEQTDEQFFSQLATEVRQPQEGQLQQDQQQTSVPDGQSQTGQPADIESVLDSVLEPGESDTAGDDTGTTDEGASTPDNQEQSNEDRIKQLQQLFSETLGVDVSEAIQNMNNFNEVSTNTLNRIQEAQQSLELRQQEIDLSLAWGVDSGTVRQRIDKAAQVYSSLSEPMQKRVRQSGVQGILQLWNAMQGGDNAPQAGQVPTGRATIARENQQNLSEVVSASSEEDFWKAIQNGNIQDDLNLL